MSSLQLICHWLVQNNINISHAYFTHNHQINKFWSQQLTCYLEIKHQTRKQDREQCQLNVLQSEGEFLSWNVTFKLKVTKNVQDMLVQKLTDIIITDFYAMHNMGNFNINWSNNWIQDAIAMQLQNKNNMNRWKLVYLCRSSSAVLRKSTVCVTGLAIRMRTSKVS